MAQRAALRRPISGFREQGQMRMADRCLIEVEAVRNWLLRVWFGLGLRRGEEAEAMSCSDCIAMPAQSEQLLLMV